MPKISLHVEADSAGEYLEILASLVLRDRYDDRPQPEMEPPADFKDDGIYAEIDTIEIPAEPVEEKKARKPRTPKMKPVTEEAPEEVEHVGTVAVSPVPDETPVTNGADEVLTRMDLGDTIAGYVRKYGINFAQTDVSKMLQDMFGADVRKKSDVPDDQPSLRKAISAITQATIDNPYNRKVDVNG